MRTWVVKTSEMLATDQGRGRLLRSGQIAHLLDRRGHEVTWWMSTFDHAARRQRNTADTEMRFGERGRIRMLRSPGYRSTVSFTRLIDHALWGRRFALALRVETPPDIIFCAYPTIESAWVCTRFGLRHGVPVVLDLRDMWPDIFFYAKGPALDPLMRVAFAPYTWMARAAFRDATALFGITEEFVDWGLRYAGRARNEWDAGYPLAYPRPTPAGDSSPASRDADAFWNSHGVRRESAFNVVVIGALNGRAYEMEAVIDAARALARDASPVRIIVCGDGDEAPRFRKLAADCPNVLFPGWISAPQIQAILRRSHLGLVPYRNTPDFEMSIPNKAVEYLSAGVPVGTSLGGTLQRVLETNDCGFHYDSADPFALVAGIRALRDSPDLHARRSSAARDLFDRSFVSENVYGALTARLESIASAAKAASHVVKTRVSAHPKVPS
jgi:glycosyltransferase involved in cell wall biosynthesis